AFTPVEREVDTPSVHRDELFPVPGPAEERIHGLERLVVVRVDGEHALVALPGFEDQPSVLLDGRESQPVLTSELRIVELARHVGIDLDQAIPSPRPFGERLEFRPRLEQARVFLDGTGLRLERAIGRPELQGGRRRDLAEELDATIPIVRRLGEDLEHPDELREIGASLVDALEDCRRLTPEIPVLEQGLERHAGPLVIGIEEQNLTIVLERGRRITEALVLRLGQAELEVDQYRHLRLELDATPDDVRVAIP